MDTINKFVHDRIPSADDQGQAENQKKFRIFMEIRTFFHVNGESTRVFLVIIKWYRYQMTVLWIPICETEY